MASAKKTPDPLSGKPAFGLFSNNKLEIYSLFGLAVIGVFFRMFITQNNDMTGDQGPATSTLWGYGLTIVAVLCLLFIIYGLSKKEFMESANFTEDLKDGFFSNIMYILGEGNIFVVVLIVLSLIVTLNYVYYQKINIGIIPESYGRFNYVSNLLMLIQFLVLFQYINLKVFNKVGDETMRGIITATTYFLSVINMIFVIIMYILLRFFSTDG